MSDFTNLPDIPAIRTLKAKPQWVSWKHSTRTKLDGTTYVTKVPVCPHNNGNASVNNPTTWGSYDEAVANTLKHGLAGVGYVLTKNDDIFGTDLDSVRDTATGKLQDFAQEVVNLGESYTEVSPSGKGLRQFCLGKLNAALTHKAAQVEVYSAGRYLTVTGDWIAGTSDEIREVPKTLKLLRARVDSFEAAGAKNKPPKKKRKKKKAASDAGGDFFRAVNDAALAALETWAPVLFPSAVYQPGTGAWRVPSYDLDRNLEEDLSLHPSGITDWGIDDMGEAPRAGRYTAIDILIEHGGAPDAKAAAFWLCERMDIAPASLGWGDPGGTIESLNKIHAVLPIGGKTRVVTFGVLEDFPDRETIVMTQTIEDFNLLNDKYRHTWVDEHGETQSVPLGRYWIANQSRRQYDGGMAFMPQHDGDSGDRLNLWRGFGVKAIKPNGKSGAAGALKEQGCDNGKRVLRRRGWTFPALQECRAKWIERYPGWEWRDPEIQAWQAEEEHGWQGTRETWVESMVMCGLKQHPGKVNLDDAPKRLADVHATAEHVAAALQRLLEAGKIQVNAAGMLEIAALS
jgi:hypothetical protein